MLRPIRELLLRTTAAVHWLYTATFLSMLVIVPLFGLLVARFRRSQFIPAIYLFFISNLALFLLAFAGDETPAWVQQVFYVWLSVFNLFVVSVFWSFMTDIFRPGQAQRLFGFIMAGGSLGAIVGPGVTVALVDSQGVTMAMFASLVCLVLATILAVGLGRYDLRRTHIDAEVIGGGVWEGARAYFAPATCCLPAWFCCCTTLHRPSCTTAWLCWWMRRSPGLISARSFLRIWIRSSRSSHSYSFSLLRD
jgi:AAA family ATP:ADP antiporter